MDKNALPSGKLIVRGLASPFGTAPTVIDGLNEPVAPLYALTAAYESSGQVNEFIGTVRIRIPLEFDVPFSILRLNADKGADALWSDIAFAFEDGTLSFETDKAGLFLLIPAQ